MARGREEGIGKGDLPFCFACADGIERRGTSREKKKGKRGERGWLWRGRRKGVVAGWRPRPAPTLPTTGAGGCR
uniref:Uncharacterized protein n=1 Tax=Oryza rufipogon TaxID=4529 RepID=A0A0E0QR17_ORYRU